MDMKALVSSYAIRQRQLVAVGRVLEIGERYQKETPGG